MRFERKFIIKKDSYSEIFFHLISLNFKKIYPDRFISSIYYDTTNFNHYVESKEGFSDRTKVRIRFYDNKIDKMTLEYKIKSADVGYKKINNQLSNLYNIKEFSIRNPIYRSKILKIKIPKILDNNLTPSLLISYKRLYLLSSCNNFRITIDKQLMFSNLRYKKNFYKNPIYQENSFNILEIKYSDQIKNLDLIDLISKNNNIYLSRCSKYTIGIDKCY